MRFFHLIQQNYKSYRSETADRRYGSIVRIFSFLMTSALLTWFTSDPSAAYSIMVTAITILTGFTFTALFSSYAMGDVGLPAAKNETDRQDLIRLAKMAKNFRVRSRYFILISIFEAILLVIASLELQTPTTLSELWQFLILNSSFAAAINLQWSSLGLPILSHLYFFMLIFIFLECLHTFYRLSETIVSIVETRREYLHDRSSS